MSPPAVKVAAREYGLDILQPNRLKDEGVIDRLKAWNPDAIVVAAFGMILRQNILDLPKFGCINVHASLLPRWRGAAPIQAAILAGDTVSGITIMKMDAGIDTGGIYKQREILIEAQDTTESLGSAAGRGRCSAPGGVPARGFCRQDHTPPPGRDQGNLRTENRKAEQRIGFQ